MEGFQPATVEPRSDQVLMFHTPQIKKIAGDLSYQRPVQPTQTYWSAALSPWQRQHLLKQTHFYIRTLNIGLCVFTFAMILSISPLSWVKFLMAEKGLELHAGLWTLCEHKLCWTNVPRPPYYLQISRIFFIFSALTAFIGFVCVIRACRQGTKPTSHLDLRLAMLFLASGTSLFLCLLFFLLQVKKHTSYNMGSSYLWIFYFNWWGSFFYIVAGIISYFNSKIYATLPSNLNVRDISLERRRLGINPKMWSRQSKEELQSEAPSDSTWEIDLKVSPSEKQ